MVFITHYDVCFSNYVSDYFRADIFTSTKAVQVPVFMLFHGLKIFFTPMKRAKRHKPRGIYIRGITLTHIHARFSVTRASLVHERNKNTCIEKEIEEDSSEEYAEKLALLSLHTVIRAYPKGNNIADHLSLYLAVADSENLPLGWRRHAKFSFTIVNQLSDNLSQHKETQHWFDETNPSRGFPAAITLTELHAKEGFLVNGKVKIVVKVDVLEVQGKVDVSEESSPVMETIVVNGFQVLPSQVEIVNRLFERHQDIASNFHTKNPYLKTAYMNVLLSLTQTMCQSPQEISKDDLAEEYAALSYLTSAGFQLDWLVKKLDEVKEKKKKEKACLAQLHKMKEELQPLKLKCSEMESQIDKIEVELSEARSRLSLYDEDDDTV
ncbi:hypothetical protein Rs2_38808 [Raphanus sativus]|nr:hypothetical protein Rs2_38808 [Raphanus sativus]